MKYAFIAAAFVAASLVGVPSAMADEEQVCVGGPQNQWMSEEAINAKIAKMTDEKFIVEVDAGCYEAEIVMNETTVVEVYMDPVTGEVIRIESQEEDS